jgi:hypothetical protein
MGVVIEKRATRNRWQPWSWLPVSVIPAAPPVSDWRLLREGPGWAQYHAATLPLELHRKETEGYRYNLSSEPPRIYVVLRPSEGGDGFPFVPFLVTASPYEAEAYTLSGNEIVEGVAMPESVIALVQAFVDRHHVEQPFVKRSRKRADVEVATRRGANADPRLGKRGPR